MQLEKFSLRKLPDWESTTLNKGRSISVTFVYNEDCEHLLANKKYLPKGVYADKQYSEEIDNVRRILRPVIRKVRRGNYKGRCRMEKDQVVIDGDMDYEIFTNYHQTWIPSNVQVRNQKILWDSLEN